MARFLRGKVVDGTSGEPLSEATVQVEDITLTTAVTGEFFTALPEGIRQVTVSAPGYETRQVKLRVTTAEMAKVTVGLQAPLRPGDPPAGKITAPNPAGGVAISAAPAWRWKIWSPRPCRCACFGLH